MIHFKCPNCDTAIKVGDEAASKKARCPACAQIVHVPQTAALEPKEEPPQIEEQPNKEGQHGGLDRSYLAFIIIPVLGFSFVVLISLLASSAYPSISSALMLLVGGPLGYVIVLELVRMPGRALAARFRCLGRVEGRSKEEIVGEVGSPFSISAQPDGGCVYQWLEGGFHICLTFRNGVCVGCSHISGVNL